MIGEIIIDEQQYTFQDVTNIVFSQSEKQFVIRIETGTNQFSDESQEESLDKLIGKEIEDQGHLAPKPVTGGNVLDSTKGSGNTLVSPVAPSITHADVPKMASSTIRVSIEKPEPPKVPDLNPLIMTSTPNEEPKVPIAPMPNQPSAKGIIIPEQQTKLDGQRFPIGSDGTAILNRTRTDLDIVVIREQQRDKLKLVDNGAEEESKKVYKKNIVLKSESFTQLSDASVRLALQTLVMKEQMLAHVYDKEDYLFIEIPTQLVVVSIIDEQQGTGDFYYEEMVSVYEGKNMRTKIDNGKDK